MAIVIAILPILFIFVGIALFARRIGGPPLNHPQAFLKRGRRAGTKRLVVCAGDSLTHAISSGDYVAMLRRRFSDQGYEFVNAGVNADLTYNLLQRLDEIIACRPDVVTILIGSNDVNATFSQKWERRYRRRQKLPAKPTFDGFHRNLEIILHRLRAESDAQIAILSMPMLGEDLDSEINQRVVRYNAALKELAAAKEVAYLPLHEELTALLSERRHPPGRSYDGGQGLMYRGIWQHYVLRRSWDEIAAGNGFLLMTDHIHLSDRGAAVVAELIAEMLTS